MLLILTSPLIYLAVSKENPSSTRVFCLQVENITFNVNSSNVSPCRIPIKLLKILLNI